ncbi:MAG: hypothetical protein IT161_00915 [Bryobacterales bacterium]|nr:hypothetical protein [Bryobacterales bacterium]
MTQETFNILVAAGVFLAAVGLIIQAFAAFGTYRAVKALRDKIEPLIPRISETLESAGKTLVNVTQTLDESRHQLKEVGNKTSEILTIANTQLVAFNAAREELTCRVRAQAERIELVLDDTLSRFQDVSHSMHRGVMRPVREVSGVLAGIKAGLQTLRRGSRPSVAEATNEDGMFI